MAQRYESTVVRSNILRGVDNVAAMEPFPDGLTGADMVEETVTEDEAGWRVAKVRRLESVDPRIQVGFDPVRRSVTLCGNPPVFRIISEITATTTTTDSGGDGPRRQHVFDVSMTGGHWNVFVVLRPLENNFGPEDRCECRLHHHPDPENPDHVPNQFETEIYNLCAAPVHVLSTEDGGTTFDTTSLLSRGDFTRIDTRGVIVVKRYAPHFILFGALM